MMRDDEDAFCHLLWDCFNDSWDSEIVERDDGFIDASAPHRYFSEFEDWNLVERTAMRYAKGRILDVGCGAGRHSLFLQQKGLEVVGIDASPFAVKTSRARGLKKVELMSSRRLAFGPGSFDTVLMLGNNFGLAESSEGAKRMLRKLARITSPKALILAESRDPYPTSDPAHLKYHERNRKRGRMGGQLRLRIRYRDYIGRWFDYLFVSEDEMTRILEGTGWRVERLIRSEGPQYVAVIGKV